MKSRNRTRFRSAIAVMDAPPRVTSSRGPWRNAFSMDTWIRKRAGMPRNVISPCLFLLVLCAAACASAPTRVDRKSVGRAGRFPRALPLAEEIRQIHGSYTRLFGFPEGGVPAVRVCWTEARGTEESEIYPACYRPDTGTILFHRTPDRMLLLHEMAHHFIHRACGHAPLWLDEGTAVYLGWSAMDSTHLVEGDRGVGYQSTKGLGVRHACA